MCFPFRAASTYGSYVSSLSVRSNTSIGLVLILSLQPLHLPTTGPGVIKLFPCSTQLSIKFILLINVKMPTTVGILTFISRINTTSERRFISGYFSFYELLKFRAQLS